MSAPKSKKENHLGEYVKLNVGGRLFHTTVGTLKAQDGMLKSMFEGDLEIKKDSEGYVMIDRDGEYFSEILNFLRRGSIPLSRPIKELEEILQEAEFYQIEPLMDIVAEKLDGLVIKESHPESSGRLLYVTKPDDNVDEFIKTAKKPVIRWRMYPATFSVKNMGEHVERITNLCIKYWDLFFFILDARPKIPSCTENPPYWTIHYNGQKIGQYSDLYNCSRAQEPPFLRLYIAKFSAEKHDHPLS